MHWIAVLALVFGTILVLGALAYAIDSMPAPLKEKLTAIFIVVAILYLVGGIGYALLYPEVRPEFDEWDDYRCAGPPYEIC